MSFFLHDEPTPQENERMLPKKKQGIFQQEDSLLTSIFQGIFLISFQGDFSSAAFFFSPPPFQTVDLCRCNFAVRLG